MRRITLLLILATFVSQCGFAPKGDQSAVKSDEQEDEYYLKSKTAKASRSGDISVTRLISRATESALFKLDRKCGDGERVARCILSEKCYANWFSRGKTCHVKMKAWCLHDPADNGIVGRYFSPAYWYNMKEIDKSGCLGGSFRESYGSNVPVKGEKVEVEEEEEEEEKIEEEEVDYAEATF